MSDHKQRGSDPERREPGRAGPTVHWVGTGLSTGSGARLLAERAGHLVLWGRTADQAAQCARRLGMPPDVEVAAFTLDALAARLTGGDVVVSMLPATEHTAVLAICVKQGAHFACSSYTTPEIEALGVAARATGLVVLTEAGLDPGIDHLLAHVLLARAKAALGPGPATLSLKAYCGGLPAVPNEFRYLFSWAPRGVLTALLSPARFTEGGVVRTVPRPWEAVVPHTVGAEEFEAYPNRDSTVFVDQYRVPSAWRVATFVRGTLRLAGWRAAWTEIFTTLETRGLSGVDELAADLSRRYPATEADLDRVVLTVEVEVRGDAGRVWSGRHSLDLVGDRTESAMARCVSTPLAVGVGRLLAGVLPAGLNRAAESAEDARSWLDELTSLGVASRFDTVDASATAHGEIS